VNVTVIVPYYEQPAMLRRQLQVWADYDDATLGRVRFIIVDDGSPKHPADNEVAGVETSLLNRIRLFRIKVDIPWNRAGARNLGATVCDTDWMVHIDTDHVLPPAAAAALGEVDANPGRWYRFRRWRVGRADETRRKDALPPDCEFGEIKPHIDSYLCTRELYWRVGGYDEDYSGMLGGGSPFLAQLTAAAPLELLPSDIALHVYTRSVVKDSSVSTLSRDTSRYSQLRKEKERTGNTRATNPLRFAWERVL
jgi:hypothetical protein